MQRHSWRGRAIAQQQQQQQQQSDLSLLDPWLHLQWHSVKNAHLKGIIIKPGSQRKVWWTCDQCPDGHPHEWGAQVSNRSRGSGCPYCSGRAVCAHNSLATKAPEVAAQWSDSNQGTPHDFTAASAKRVTWECCHGHEWKTTIKHRTINQSGCPWCQKLSVVGKTQQHCPTLTQSQHPMMQYWDWETNATAGFDPSRITCHSTKRTHWICHECPRGQPHRWQATASHVYKGRGCPFCTSRKICVCNSLKSLHPDMAEEWDYDRNEGVPEDYTAQSNISVWWRNSKRGSFQARISNRTYVRKPLPPAKPLLGMMPALVVHSCCLPLSGLRFPSLPSLCPAVTILPSLCPALPSLCPALPSLCPALPSLCFALPFTVPCPALTLHCCTPLC